jgi:hypothetical protein
MKRAQLNSLADWIIGIAWAFLFLTITVTSFPFFPGGIGGATLVRPMAVYPLIVLLILVTIPRLFNQSLPKTLLPLAAFSIIALASSLISLTFNIEPLFGVTAESRLVRNLATLLIGVSFYLTIALLHKDWQDLNYSIRWLYIGFAVALAWGTVQSVYVIYFNDTYFEIVSTVQKLLSTRRLFTTRISGLTFEPKWFAEQIAFLLMPLLLASVISGRSVFKFRWRAISIEWFLLFWSAAVIIFTFSRTGYLAVAAMAFLAFLLYRFRAHRSGEQNQSRGLGISWLRILEAGVVAGGLLILFLVLGSQNNYISRFWRYWTDDRPARKTYLEYIAFQQRFIYWETALEMFENYPLTGVGLGNYAFYFEEMLPDVPYNQQPEIIRQITPIEGRSQLITPKNLYARLMSETGLLGTVTFTSFLLAITGCLLYLWLSKSEIQSFWAVAGLLGGFTFLIMIFSYDSFAVPNMWVYFGLVTAAAHLEDPAPV